MQEHSQTPPVKTDETVSVLEKNIYGIPWIVHQIVAMSVMSFIFPIFTIEWGISASLVGIMIGLSRFWDAFTDPIMGNITDNFSSRFGRRRPFIVIGAVATGITFPLIFAAPQSWSHTLVVVWMAVSLFIMLTAYTVFIVPLIALGFEMAEDVKERTSVQAYRAAWVAVASLLPPWLYRIAQDPSFSNPIEGARIVSIVVGICLIVIGAVPIFFLRERVTEVVSGPENKIKFIPAFLATVRNRQFLILIGFTISFLTGATIVSAFGAYLNIYFVYDGDKRAATTMLGIFGTVSAIVAFLSIPVSAWLARRIGKVKTIALCLWALLVGTLLQWVGFNPAMPWLQLVLVAPALAFSSSGFWVLVSSMKADICDYDELQTGRYRAGMYGAVSGWFQKLAIFGATALAGVLIAATMIDPGLGAAQAPEAILKLRIVAILPGLILAVFSLVLVRYYTLTEERMLEIQQELRARRNQAVSG